MKSIPFLLWRLVQAIHLHGRRCSFVLLFFLCLAGLGAGTASGAAYIYNSWWSNPIDLDGDLCVSSARLNWDADVIGGFGSSTVYERIYYRLTGNSSWILYYTTSPHTISGASALDSLYINVPGSGLCAFYDYRIEVYQFGSTFFYDDAWHLYGHAEEGAAFDIPIFASIYDAWWTAAQDTDGDSCVSSARLNWDVDLFGTTGTLNVYEKIYYKPTGTGTWLLYTTTTTHPVTGSSASDAVFLTIPGSGSCTLYDYRIEVYLAGFTGYDDFADYSNDSSLSAHREEEFDGPPPDVTAPTIMITAPTANPTYFTHADPLNLTGTAGDNVGVILVTWENDQGGSGIANGTSAWSIPGIPLQPGQNTITVIAEDGAGNTAADQVLVVLDLTSPILAITVPSPDATFITPSSVIELRGTASDNQGMTQLTWTNNHGGSGTAPAVPNWVVPAVPLQSGTNAITVTAHDAAGNEAEQTVLVIYDPVRPVVSVTAPTNGATYVTIASPLSISGTAFDGVGVSRVVWKNDRGGEGEANGSDSWSVDGILLALGINCITVTAFDLARNSSTYTLTVTYNPFGPVSGSYNGLIHEPDCLRHQSSGAFRLSVSAKGSYSVAVQIGGKRLSVTGKLDGAGLATNYLRLQSNLAELTWAVNLHGSQQVTGKLTATGWAASLLGDRTQIYSTTNLAPYEGKFTWRLPGFPADTNLPAGDGGGSATVGRTHILSLSGSLADGTALAQQIQISKQGKAPLYVSLLSGKGSLIGWLNFDTNAPSDDFFGNVCWVSPSLPTKKLYTQGFTFVSTIEGSLYRKPVIPVTRALDLTNALIELHGGGLPRGITNDVALRFDSVFVNQGTNALKISVNITKGTFTGTATEGGSKKRTNFKGSLFQKDSSGSGFFLGINDSGRVRIFRSDP